MGGSRIFAAGIFIGSPETRFFQKTGFLNSKLQPTPLLGGLKPSQLMPHKETCNWHLLFNKVPIAILQLIAVGLRCAPPNLPWTQVKQQTCQYGHLSFFQKMGHLPNLLGDLGEITQLICQFPIKPSSPETRFFQKTGFREFQIEMHQTEAVQALGKINMASPKE